MVYTTEHFRKDSIYDALNKNSAWNEALKYHDERNFDSAERGFRQLAVEFEGKVGPLDKKTLRCKRWLGATLARLGRYSEAREPLQEATDGFRYCADEQDDILQSRSWLAYVLYMLHMYSEAAELLKQVSGEIEMENGPLSRSALDTKFWLGRSLHSLNRYRDAEAVFQCVLIGQEATLGSDEEAPDVTKYWLARSLNKQRKHSQAEQLFRQVTDAKERKHGSNHEETLDTGYWLGRSLIGQKKYREAEELLQRIADMQEEANGGENVNTLHTRYWLGRSLNSQKKYKEATLLLQQVAEGQDKVLGSDHEETLDTKYWLGRSFHNRQNYGQAERLLSKVAAGFENKHGKSFYGSLIAKYWLGRSLYDNGKYDRAETPLLEATDGFHKMFGDKHTHTNKAIVLLEEIQRTKLQNDPWPSSESLPTFAPKRLGSYFTEGDDRQRPYSDSEISEISKLLEQSDPRWSKIPRTYIILRMVGHLNVLDDLIEIGFSDYWFPVTERSLPGCLNPSIRKDMVRLQSLVMTKAMDLEKGEMGQHCHFEPGERAPFMSRGVLGTGGFGQVDKVTSSISFRNYARKKLVRSTAFRGPGKRNMELFIHEIQIMKRLKHMHIVEYIGSYTDAECISLIMTPVADMDLSAYLKQANSTTLPELRTFFGCLANSLRFLHENRIRHKDIKPANILVHCGNVLFTDFGLARDCTDADGSTTMNMVNGLSPRYCAPEVALYEPRNTMSDIWSLGVVFMEMITVLKGKTPNYLDELFTLHGAESVYIRSNVGIFRKVSVALRNIGEPSDNRALDWTLQMLSAEQKFRLTAAMLVEIITDFPQGSNEMSFCGTCCTVSME